jgi:hypothetical protein
MEQRISHVKMMRIQQGKEIKRTAIPSLFKFLIPHSSLLIFLLLSCQTTPKTSDTSLDETEFLPLEAGAFAYIIADVPNAMPILNQTSLLQFKTKQLQQMLDKTRSAVVAMYLPPSEQRYRLVSWGNYPVFRAKMALGFSRDWKKQRSKTSGEVYWYSAKEGISVALDQGQAWVLSSEAGVPVEPFSALQGSNTGIPVPEGFNDFSGGAILSCWLNEPGPLLNLKLQEMGLPIEIPADLIFVNIYPAGEDQYEALLRIQVSSATQARALAVVLSLARTFISLSMPDASGGNPAGGSSANSSFEVLQAIFFSNPSVQDDRNLNIKTGILSSAEIALLFGIFSL